MSCAESGLNTLSQPPGKSMAKASVKDQKTKRKRQKNFNLPLKYCTQLRLSGWKMFSKQYIMDVHKFMTQKKDLKWSDKLSLHITGRVGNRTTASSFEIQGMTSAVSVLLLKIPICSFSQLSSFTSASQDESTVWFFKKTCSCSALQGRKKKGGKKKEKEKETETEEVFC